MSSKNNYYKFAIQTSDGMQLSNVIEYHGLILGKITNTVRQANPQRQKCTEMFALMRYKQSDKRFHLINTAPHWHLRLYNEIKFLTSKLAIIDKYNSRTCDYTYFLTELDTDKLILKIIAESSVMHYQSIAIANTPIIGGVIYQDSVYEPTHQNAHKSCQSGKSSHTIREIDRVANIIASVSDIPHQFGGVN